MAMAMAVSCPNFSFRAARNPLRDANRRLMGRDNAMTTMISEVYEAFKEANVSDETARKAAEAVAAY
jgi:hypothetical protein